LYRAPTSVSKAVVWTDICYTPDGQLARQAIVSAALDKQEKLSEINNSSQPLPFDQANEPLTYSDTTSSQTPSWQAVDQRHFDTPTEMSKPKFALNDQFAGKIAT